MEERKNLIHNLILENRQKMSVSGVEDVESFDEENVILHTQSGVLTVQGSELHINKLNVESGELIIEGMVTNLNYNDGDEIRRGGGFFSKLFK